MNIGNTEIYEKNFQQLLYSHKKWIYMLDLSPILNQYTIFILYRESDIARLATIG
jgi:hypothetical protein